MLSGNLFSDLALLQRITPQSNTAQSSSAPPASGLPPAGSSYSLNNGNIQGSMAVVDGQRVHYEERVKLFGGSQQLTLTDRQGNEVSVHTQHHHRVDIRA
ncbi:hypothetical protein [Thioalkalivibrio sp. ALE19]|uniref:hypothetical protein n=1 Tax=Thioalkalivibrio sp. ALE19 TaxID=1266909 RepID=UPI0004043DF8|nr:hypothetical protein [Thioalkalivibrio sp. ALE19]